LSNLESEINKLEREIKEIDKELANNYNKAIAIPDFFENYQSKKKKLEEKMSIWGKISEEIDQYA
ncbi:MAG: ABC transporter ATP-binding protein, partial [Leeuwenhoekiella sp.]